MLVRLSIYCRTCKATSVDGDSVLAARHAKEVSAKYDAQEKGNYGTFEVRPFWTFQGFAAKVLCSLSTFPGCWGLSLLTFFKRCLSCICDMLGLHEFRLSLRRLACVCQNLESPTVGQVFP